MYAIKFEFDTDTSLNTGTQIRAYPDLRAAAGMFNRLLLARANAEQVPVVGGKKINILSVWFYKSDAPDPDDAVAAVKAGTAQLIDETSDALDDELDALMNTPPSRETP